MFDQLNEASEHLYPAAQDQSNDGQGEVQKNIPQHDSSKETSMRILRERAESAERRTMELERMMQMNMSQQRPQQNNRLQIEEEDEYLDVTDDNYIEGRQLKKYVKSLKQELKNTKKQFEEYNQQNALHQAEIRLKNQFNDFDSVVNKDNLERLQHQKPVLYRTILANADIYDKGYAAYEMIKSSGILNDQYEDIDRKVEENRSRPRAAANASPQSGDTPLTRIGDYDRRILSEDRKDMLRKQVEEAKRNR